MERSSDNKNQGMQNEEVIIFIIEIENVRVGCNSLSNLIKLIESYVGFEEKLEKYEGEFEIKK